MVWCREFPPDLRLSSHLQDITASRSIKELCRILVGTHFVAEVVLVSHATKKLHPK